MVYPEELLKVAEFHGGELLANDGEFYIKIDTGDRTSKENYDELLDMREDIEVIIKDSGFEILDLWCDHDTQIIEFEYVEC